MNYEQSRNKILPNAIFFDASYLQVLYPRPSDDDDDDEPESRIITFSTRLFFILCLSPSLLLHLADCRVAFERFPCSRALASAPMEECNDRTNERETNVSARERGTKKNRDPARRKLRQVLRSDEKKRIRSDVSVRIERIFRKWQMHVITCRPGSVSIDRPRDPCDTPS